jgi:hypothetical protein
MVQVLHLLKKNVLESTSYLSLLGIKTSFNGMACKTVASTNSLLFALLWHFGLQYNRNLRLEFCNSNESLDYELPTFGDF